MLRTSYSRASKTTAINNMKNIIANLDKDYDMEAYESNNTLTETPTAISIETPTAISIETPTAISIETPTAISIETPASITTETPADLPKKTDNNLILDDMHNILKNEVYEVNGMCRENTEVAVKNIKNYLSLTEGGTYNTLKYAPDMLKYIIYNPFVLSYPKFNATVKAKMDEMIIDVDKGKANNVITDLYKAQFMSLCKMVQSMCELYQVIYNKDIFNNNLEDIANKTAEFTDSLKKSYTPPESYPIKIIDDMELNGNIQHMGTRLGDIVIESNYRSLVESLHIKKYQDNYYLSRHNDANKDSDIKYYKFPENTTIKDIFKQFYSEDNTETLMLKDINKTMHRSITEKGAILYKD